LDAELYAIAKALKETIQRHIKIFNKRLIRIFTDSEWALRSTQDDVRGPGQWLVRKIAKKAGEGPDDCRLHSGISLGTRT
jgi:hypothetical protein